jgi:hypothetical protein
VNITSPSFIIIHITGVTIVTSQAIVEVGIVASRTNSRFITLATTRTIYVTLLFVFIVNVSDLANLTVKVQVHIGINTVYATRTLLADATFRTGRHAFIGKEV